MRVVSEKICTTALMLCRSSCRHCGNGQGTWPCWSIISCDVLRTANGVAAKRIDTDALEVLEEHAWPGNVRELENLMQRLVLMVTGPTIAGRHLPQQILYGLHAARGPTDTGRGNLVRRRNRQDRSGLPASGTAPHEWQKVRGGRVTPDGCPENEVSVPQIWPAGLKINCRRLIINLSGRSWLSSRNSRWPCGAYLVDLIENPAN